VSDQQHHENDSRRDPGYELFQHLRSGIAVYSPVDDGADFVFVDFNPAAERIDDIDRDALIGRSVREMFPAVDDFGLLEVLQRVWYTGTPELHPVSRYSDGRVDHWVRNFVYRTGDGLMVAVFDDMTGRLDADDVAQRQGQRLQAIGTLAGGLAHEINNPIHTILTAAEFLRMELESLSPEHSEYAQIISEQCSRVSRIINGLLAFSRQDRGGRAPTHLRTVIEGAAHLIQATLERDGVRLELELADDLPPARCQAQQIQQALINVIENARDAVEDQHPPASERRIVVRAKRRDEGPQTWVRVTVEDAGPGIPGGVLDRVFEPFFTTRSPVLHAGLGLSVAHGIMKDHEGTIILDSRPGAGTRVFLDFPAIRENLPRTPLV
jgi:signal transduction histidine kinase